MIPWHLSSYSPSQVEAHVRSHRVRAELNSSVFPSCFFNLLVAVIAEDLFSSLLSCSAWWSSGDSSPALLLELVHGEVGGGGWKCRSRVCTGRSGCFLQAGIDAADVWFLSVLCSTDSCGVCYGWSFHVPTSKNLLILHWRLFAGWLPLSVPSVQAGLYFLSLCNE